MHVCCEAWACNPKLAVVGEIHLLAVERLGVFHGTCVSVDACSWHCKGMLKADGLGPFLCWAL